MMTKTMDKPWNTGRWIGKVIHESETKGFVTAERVAEIRREAGYGVCLGPEAMTKLKKMKGIMVIVIGDIGRKPGQVGREAKKYRIEMTNQPEGRR